MKHWSRILILILATSTHVWATPSAVSQVIERERDSTITGPRGRSIERKLDVQRGPGFYQRQLQIQRPGGTLERDMTIQRGFRPGFGGGGLWPRPPVYLGREVLMLPRPATNFSFGLMAAPLITIPFGAGAGVAAGGVAPTPGPVGPGGSGGSGGAAAPPPQPSPLDPVALAASKLQSHHSNSRRDGARELGRLGDPRAVPALVHVLKYDSSKDVRVAAATALGQIGGSEAEVVLERCIIYEKKQDVRDAAAAALRHARNTPHSAASNPSTVGQPAPEATIPPQQSDVPRLSSPLPSPGSRTSPFRPRHGQDEPSLEGPGSGSRSDINPNYDSGPDSHSGSDTAADVDRVPPPAPVPIKPQ